MSDWVCYIVQCSDGSLYTGVTNDLKSRLKAHNEGKGARYTKSRLPVKLIASRKNLTRSKAQKLEMLVKAEKRHNKIVALVRG